MEFRAQDTKIVRFLTKGFLWLGWSIDCNSTCCDKDEHVELQSIDHHSQKLPVSPRTLCCLCLRRCCFGLETKVIIKI